MEIVVKRKFRAEEYTIGDLFIDGEWFCNTLEDKDRGLTSDMSLQKISTIKVKGKTCIPTGTYKITLNVVSPGYGGKKPYKTVCGGKIPRILDVPGFDGVLIHIGNFAKDTEGCLLLGFNTVKGAVTKSTETWTQFYEKIKNETNITITYC